MAIGFLIPPMIVHESSDMNQISSELYAFYIGTAILTTIIFLLIIICKLVNLSTVIHMFFEILHTRVQNSQPHITGVT